MTEWNCDIVNNKNVKTQ